MLSIIQECGNLPIQSFAAGELIIKEGGRCGCIFFLKSGTLQVSRNAIHLADISEVGEVLGEISILLDRPHIAQVEAKTDVEFYIVDHPDDFLTKHPLITLHIARSLARKVDSLGCYIADLKTQYADDKGEIGVINDVLDSLVNIKH